MNINKSLTPFPLRTLMVCFTAWLIATEVLVFDRLEFDAKNALLEQAARALHAPEVVVPGDRPSAREGGGKMQQLCKDPSYSCPRMCFLLVSPKRTRPR